MTKQGGWAGGPRGLFSPRQHLRGGGAFPHTHTPTSGFLGAAVVMVTTWHPRARGHPPHYACQRKGPWPLLYPGWGQRHTKKPGSQTSCSRGKPPAFSASQPSCLQWGSSEAPASYRPCEVGAQPMHHSHPCIYASLGQDTERNKVSPGSLSSCWHWGRVGDEQKANSA